MEKDERISRREALKKMSKTALVVAAATVLPKIDASASEFAHQYYNYSNYSNYYNYSNYSNYYNYSNYSNYVNRSR